MFVIFGNPKIIAVEAIVEPGPEYPATIGKNIAGRVCLHIGGHVFGNFAEPCCILGSVSNHLAEICSSKSLWHYSLAGLSPVEMFEFLDHLIYGEPEVGEPSGALGGCVFLTNQSEAFDGIKAFAIRSTDCDFLILAERTGRVESFVVPLADFQRASHDFSSWLELQSRLE